MKAKHVTVFTAIIFLFFVIAPSCKACNEPLEEFSDGYFRYVVVGEESRFADRGGRHVIAIIGFTELGLQQEVIDIPREIDGKPVMFIGYDDNLRPWFFIVETGNIKKLYIYDNIKNFIYFTGIETNIMCCSVNDKFSTYNDHYKNAYFYGSLIETHKITEELDVSAANVVFINNYSTEDNYGYCGLDNVEEGEKIHKPLDPERSGYEFTGWYTEPECENLWDFDTVPVIEEDSEFRLYASWREI